MHGPILPLLHTPALLVAKWDKIILLHQYSVFRFWCYTCFCKLVFFIYVLYKDVVRIQEYVR